MSIHNVIQTIVEDSQNTLKEEWKYIGDFLLEGTRHILENENIPYTVTLKGDVFSTHCNRKKREIQYGHHMIRAIMENRFRQSRGYYIIKPDHYRILIFSGYFRKYLEKGEKFISIMLEEIAHVYPSRSNHRGEFLSHFATLWKKYFTYLKDLYLEKERSV